MRFKFEEFDPDAFLAQAEPSVEQPTVEAPKTVEPTREPAAVKAPEKAAEAFDPDAFIKEKTGGEFNPDSFIQEKVNEKFGDQTGIAALEGIAQGVAGPLASFAETKLLGIKPEDIRGRAEANPWAHGLGEAAGLVGSMLTGVGEAALLEKVAAPVAAAITSSKVGSTAIKGAIEAGLFQAGDELSKTILQDPEASVANAMTHGAMAVMSGGLFGAAAGKVGEKLMNAAESKTANKLSKWLADFGHEYKFLDENPNLPEAAYQEASNLWKAVNEARIGGYSLKQQAINKLTETTSQEMAQKHLNEVSNFVTSAPKILKESTAFNDVVQEWMEKVAPKEGFIPSPADIFRATDDFKRQLQEGARLVYNFKTGTKLSDLREAQAFAKLANSVKNTLEDKAVWGEMGTFQKELNKAHSSLVDLSNDFIKTVGAWKEGERVINKDSLINLLNAVKKGKGELKAAKVLDFIPEAQKMLNSVEELHSKYGIENSFPPVPTTVLERTLNLPESSAANMARWLFGRGPGAIGWAGGHAVGTATGAILGHPYLGYRAGEHAAPLLSDLVGNKLTKAGVAAVLKALSHGSTEGVPQAIHYSQKIANGAANVDKAVENLFVVGGQKALNSTFSKEEKEELKKFIESGELNEQIENEKQPQSPAVFEEQKFAHGGVVEQPIPVIKKPEKRKVTATEAIAKIGGAFPDHTMQYGMAKGRIYNYLNSLRPQATGAKLPFDSHYISPEKSRNYDQAINVATKPLHVLDKVKQGSLTADEVEHLKNMFPELYGQLQKKITERISKAQLDKEKPSHKVMQSLSLFMGTPLDSTLSPQNIMAAQAVFTKQKQALVAAPAATKMKGLEKAPRSYMTQEQARSQRQKEPI